MITNEEVKARSGQIKLDITLRPRGLTCLGHAHRVDFERIPRQAGYGVEAEWEERKGTTENALVQHLGEGPQCHRIELGHIAAQLTKDRQVWRSCIALCAPHGIHEGLRTYLY